MRTALQPMKPRILNVEDDNLVQDVISGLLEQAGYQAGYEVALSSTLADGLRRVQSEHFNLIILDYVLPDGTGLELCRAIRRLDPHSPLLFFTGEDHGLNQQWAVSVCAQGCLTKPLGIYDLVATVARLLDEAQSFEEDVAGSVVTSSH